MPKLIERRKPQPDTQPPSATLVTTRRANQLTGIPRRTIQAWAADGRITALRDGPKLWLVSIADIQRLAATLKPGRKPAAK